MEIRILLKDLLVLMGTLALLLWSWAGRADAVAAICELELTSAIGQSSELTSDQVYYTGDAHLRSVTFDPKALKEMKKLDDQTVDRLLRSVRKGFVPPVSGPGVVRLTDIHRNLVEVKIVRKSVTRLIGCFESGHLHIMRVYHKRNEGRGGALGNFRDLCD